MVRERDEAMSEDEWFSELPTPSADGGGRRRFLDDGFRTGVKVKDDGRLDMKIRQHNASVATLLDQLERTRKSSEPRIQPQPSRPDCYLPNKNCFPLTLNIVIHVVGSRGDIQPFIALGKELRKHGHRVRIATHLAFKDSIIKHGLEFFSIGGDPGEMMAFMVRNPGLLPDFQTIRSGDLQKHRECVKAMVCGCWHSCFDPGDGTSDPETLQPFVADAIIANPPSFAHVNCAEKLGVPLHMMFTMPWSATQVFPHPLANVKRYRAKRSVANFVSYAIVEMIIWEGLGDIFNKFRKKELGLDPLDAIQAPSLLHRLNVPYTYLWSPALLPKPDDWPEYVDITGFSFLSSGTDYTPPEDIDNFLKAGPRPVYIGFGSIVVDDPEKLTKSVYDAVKKTGQRAIISKGWGNLGGSDVDVPENVLLIGNCPHDWLFQHVSCVVHHGGAGTTATGLYLRRPTVVVSFFGDQLFWGTIVARAGAGPKPIPYRELNSERLAAGIRKALEESTLERANEIGEQMHSENGVEDAVWSFHRHLDLDKLRCALVSHKPAVWQVKHSKTALSAVAAAVLINAGYLKQDNLNLHRASEYYTNRDPRGPISAGAEVLAGTISNFVSGVGVLPLEMLQVFNATRVMAHCQPETKPGPHLPAQAQAAGHSPSPSRRGSRSHSTTTTTQPTDEEEEEEEEETREEQSNTLEQIRSLQQTRTQTKRAREDDQFSPSSRISVPAGEEGRPGVLNRFAKRLVNGIILIPMDITLSLSRGFHNAPKLYHDRMVKATRRVVGFRSGLRTAGEELVSGFYNGVTGLVTQPYSEMQRAGGKGLAKGVAKGIGGVFLKPPAGIWGLAGYPLQGLHIHIRRSLAKTSARETVISSRLAQGMQEMEKLSDEEREAIRRKWRELQGIEGVNGVE